MAGIPVTHMVDGYGSYAAPGAAPVNAADKRQPTNTSFIVWLVLIGVVLPVAIIGGLRAGGFSFVFKR